MSDDNKEPSLADDIAADALLVLVALASICFGLCLIFGFSNSWNFFCRVMSHIYFSGE